MHGIFQDLVYRFLVQEQLLLISEDLMKHGNGGWKCALLLHV